MFQIKKKLLLKNIYLMTNVKLRCLKRDLFKNKKNNQHCRGITSSSSSCKLEKFVEDSKMNNLLISLTVEILYILISFDRSIKVVKLREKVSLKNKIKTSLSTIRRAAKRLKGQKNNSEC